MNFLWWFLLVFLFGTFAGHALHWIMHQRWSGRLRRSHLAHHRLYPYSDYYSTKYRGASKDNSALFFIPAIALVVCILLWFAPAEFRIWLFLEGALIGAANEIAHIHFHLKDSRLKRFKWFIKLEDAHKEHHRKVNRNYGIIWLGWDRIFRTYKAR